MSVIVIHVSMEQLALTESMTTVVNVSQDLQDVIARLTKMPARATLVTMVPLASRRSMVSFVFVQWVIKEIDVT